MTEKIAQPKDVSAIAEWIFRRWSLRLCTDKEALLARTAKLLEAARSAAMLIILCRGRFSPRLPGGQRSKSFVQRSQKKRALRREQPPVSKSIRFWLPSPTKSL